MKVGSYSKFIVAVLGAAVTSLQTYYGTQHWVPVVIAVLTAVVVYLVPNQPS